MCLTQLNTCSSCYDIDLCSVTFGRFELLKIRCSYCKHFLINSGTCMQICKHAHRTITLSVCNVVMSITVAVSCNSEDQSAHAHHFAALPARHDCVLPCCQWHGMLLWLAHKTSGCGHHSCLSQQIYFSIIH